MSWKPIDDEAPIAMFPRGLPDQVYGKTLRRKLSTVKCLLKGGVGQRPYPQFVAEHKRAPTESRGQRVAQGRFACTGKTNKGNKSWRDH